MRASLSRSWTLAGAAIMFAALAGWAIVRALRATEFIQGNGGEFALVYMVAFMFLCLQMALCYRERPWKGDGSDLHVVVVNVPVYNEDPALLRTCLASLLNQTRPPNEIHVVDDGSKLDYRQDRLWFIHEALDHGVSPNWTRTPNRGKRHAQGETIRATPHATIYLTVDSDADLDPHAIEEGLKPFARKKVMSVAGIVLASNCKANLLARFTDLWFVTGQLVDRSAFSAMGSVLVNSGVLAFYRAEVLRDNLDGYLNETFFGRPVEFSDDSMLTIYALQRGWTVQQPTSFAFTAMPENLSHHIRQQLRWNRGAFIRSWWRFKYLPMNRYAYWGHLLGWVQFAMASLLFALLFVVRPIHGHFSPLLLVVPLLVGYGMSLRYMMINRSDQSRWFQFGTFLLSPVASLWAFFVLRPVRWYAMATCFKTGWGTRQEVEIKAVPAEQSIVVQEREHVGVG